MSDNTENPLKSTSSGPSTIVEGPNYVPALGFDALTPLYQKVVDVFCRDSRVKREILARIEGQDMQILDAACGTGKLVRMLAKQQQCCAITGMDIDPKMIATATKETADHSNVSIVLGDLRALPFNDDSFDVVIESLVLHHLDDNAKRAALAGIRRVLRRDGIFYYVDWVKPTNLYSKIAFQIVKVLDGKKNVQAHANNAVFDYVSNEFERVAEIEPLVVQTSVGTLAIIAFTPIKE